MSVADVIARVSELQTALNGGVTPAPQTGTPTATFQSVLGQQTGLTGTSAVGAVTPGGTAGERMVALAQKEIGVAEQPPGSNDAPRIAQYRQATAGSAVGPWCAYFTSWLAKSAGVPLGEQGQGFGGVDALYAWRSAPAAPCRTARTCDRRPAT